MATELTSTTITNILEAVPGIKTVLRSPAADAMVNLTRVAAGLGAFDIKDARELMRFAFRRGLINNEEHDRVLGDVENATQAREDRLAARRASREPHGGRGHRAKPKAAAHHGKAAHVAKHHPAKKAKRFARKSARPAPKKKPVARKPKTTRKARPAARPKASAGRPKKHK